MAATNVTLVFFPVKIWIILGDFETFIWLECVDDFVVTEYFKVDSDILFYIKWNKIDQRREKGLSVK